MNVARDDEPEPSDEPDVTPFPHPPFELPPKRIPRRRRRESVGAMRKKVDAMLEDADKRETERQARIAAGTDTPADHVPPVWILHGLRKKPSE